MALDYRGFSHGGSVLYPVDKTAYSDVVHDSVSPFDLNLFSDAWTRESQLPQPDITWTENTGSTNDDLAAAAESGSAAPFSILGTDHQQAGRGRLARTWTTPPRTCLTFSIAVPVPPTVAADDLGWIPLITGRAVVDALRAEGVPAELKWPNDVLIRDRKLAGILTRIVIGADGAKTVVIGTGINVHLAQDDLPVETATSLLVEGFDFSREVLLAAVVSRLREALDSAFSRPAVGTAEFCADMSDSMATIGRDVRVELPGREPLTARAVGLDAHGGLVIETSEGLQTVTAGDVVHARLV